LAATSQATARLSYSALGKTLLQDYWGFANTKKGLAATMLAIASQNPERIIRDCDETPIAPPAARSPLNFALKESEWAL